jgi:glycosyltransferase involved in cell wall biosynthesis
MKILMSHPIGNTYIRAVIGAIDNAGLLAEFDTTIAVDPNALWLRFLPTKIKEELLRRSYQIDFRKIHVFPVREIFRLLAPKLGFNIVTTHEYGWASVDAVLTEMDLQVSKRVRELVKKKNITAVYAYEDCAFETFKVAKQLGLKCIYDLPIAYWEKGRELMQEEAIRLPEWAVTLGGGIGDSNAKVERKVKEMEMADVIVVPGSFVMDSLPTWSIGKKVIVAPFGTPKIKNLGENQNRQFDLKIRPLRVLFVGSMGQRKGLGDLFEAFKILNNPNVQLIVMGSLLAPLEFYKGQLESFIYEEGRSHEQVLALMRTCDVFCLPSIVEGRALVMQEAMSQQLPILITSNTGGADLVIEGETGFLIPIRAPQLIAEKIQWFSDNRNKIPEMGVQAQLHAEKYTWDSYGQMVLEGIVDYLSN